MCVDEGRGDGGGIRGEGGEELLQFAILPTWM